LIEEVLDKLLLQRSGSEQAVEVSPEKFGDKVASIISMYI